MAISAFMSSVPSEDRRECVLGGKKLRQQFAPVVVFEIIVIGNIIIKRRISACS